MCASYSKHQSESKKHSKFFEELGTNLVEHVLSNEGYRIIPTPKNAYPEIKFTDGEKTYVIAQNGLQVGQKLVSGPEAQPEIGNTLPLSRIPLGTVISGTEESNGFFSKMIPPIFIHGEYNPVILANFCKRQKLKSAIFQSVDLLQSGKYDEVGTLIQDALRAGLENNLGHDYFLDIL
jgi:hypothetical protein